MISSICSCSARNDRLKLVIWSHATIFSMSSWTTFVSLSSTKAWNNLAWCISGQLLESLLVLTRIYFRQSCGAHLSALPGWIVCMLSRLLVRFFSTHGASHQSHVVIGILIHSRRTSQACLVELEQLSIRLIMHACESFSSSLGWLFPFKLLANHARRSMITNVFHQLVVLLCLVLPVVDVISRILLLKTFEKGLIFVCDSLWF